MAITRKNPAQPRRASRRGLPSMTERQLSAYFIARDTLRRLRDAGMKSAGEADPEGSRRLH
jgi:hypothetical protein